MRKSLWLTLRRDMKTAKYINDLSMDFKTYNLTALTNGCTHTFVYMFVCYLACV